VKELKQLAPSSSTLMGRSACMNQPAPDHRAGRQGQQPHHDRRSSGAGKELAARTLHHASPRAEGPFVVINAAAITPERMEVELFGIEQSNGEQARKPGALEEAHGGTLFIDEIATCPRDPEQDFARAGRSDVSTLGGTVRFTSTSALCPPPRATWKRNRRRRFREDLFHRLSVCRSGCRRCPSAARIFPN